MKQTPLYQYHLDVQAKMAEFAGFDMPIYYSSIKQEHLLVRNKVAIFDTTHMGIVKLISSATDCEKFLMRKISDLPVGAIRYNRIMNDQGGVVDDILVYRRVDDFLAVFNAANIEKDLNYFQGKQVTWQLLNLHLIAVQGPEAVNVLADPQLLALGYYRFVEKEFSGKQVLISRTGYTGEDGFEIMATTQDCLPIWQHLLDLGISPAGLGARDSLRIEAGMPLYGHELKDNWTNHKSNAIQGVKMLEKGMLPQDALLFDENSQQIGQITSATFSPVLDCSIGMFTCDSPVEVDSLVYVSVRDKLKKAQVVKLPFINKNRNS